MNYGYYNLSIENNCWLLINSKIIHAQDGVLKEVNATKLSLIAENGRHIESVFTKSDKISVGDEIESDGHLILIDVS